MNIGGGDEYDERARTGEGVPGPYGPEPGRRTGTRTRLPGSEGTGRPPARPGRSMVTVVAVIVLLIAAIAFANQSGGGGDDGGGDKGGGGDGPKAQPTAPSGDKPVKSASGAVPSGFAHSKNGAQSAAANYAVALGGDGMFNRDRRHEIVEALADPGSVDKLQSGFDSDYNEKLNKSIGLDADGKAPSGSTFVNRTIPSGADVKDYSSRTATVAVWCTGLFGLAAEDSTKPVTSNWFTVTFKLRWSEGDWKVVDSKQKNGPTPVNGDSPVSGADEIGDATERFGGFTYAR
ncbi:hypothetical protein [Streptomyces cacaoi]|uniref:DUF8175 domain-containing protein n=1 Tax=Streptomyces cacaoi TaxID=1898 RepID=A0A4Y3REG6_STRCI|nr:hypothetical protein [Streptomyces cacaoi]GEB54160.1 hypothetical protein SCA03_67110 [Streptomyces cacaoi]